MSECRIRVLEAEVAGQIAAGEVVERPASVVKELVENSLDAGATRITVEVEDGGRKLIRITDNGCGMSAQEAVLSLQRHATSKIRRAEDLAAVRTLGFRGEALPSIASVSRFTLVTRPRGELEGVRLEAEGGEIQALEPAGAAEGSIVTVADLFYNTPARLKFLKTPRTELTQICDMLTRLALSRPEVSLLLLADGGETLRAPGSPDPLNTVAALFGHELARELLPVRAGRPGIAVEGYLSRPTVSRPTRSGQHFFVNGRWVRNRTLTHAVDEACRSALPSGRFAFAVLHVEIDPALLDVNVHPNKTEIRFLREWEVHRAVAEAVRSTLGGGTEALGSAPLAQHAMLGPEALRQGPWLPPTAPSSPTSVPIVSRSAPETERPLFEPVDVPLPEPPPEESAVAGVPLPASTRSEEPLQPPPIVVQPAQAQPTFPELTPPPPSLRPITQLWNSYLLAEGPTGIVIIDQHLAHERVLFDRLRAGTGGEGDEERSRPLSPPLTLTLTHREARQAEALDEELIAVGYRLEAFGRDAFVIRAVPTCVPVGSEVSTLRQLLEDLTEGRAADPDGAPALERVAAATACRTAIRKGARLGPEEVARLLGDLSRSANPHTCPHGCPITVEIRFQELLRRFKRI